jgi:hypothetical protein
LDTTYGGIALNKRAKLQDSYRAAHRYILWGIPFVFAVGSLLHFIYDWSGQSTLIGIFAPVNESVWEHLKMAFWPMLVWWLAGYIIFRKNNWFGSTKWICAGAWALWISPLAISSLFYLYTGALGIESPLLDIVFFLLSITLSQFLALHIYKFAVPKPWCTFVSIAVVALLTVAFIVYTFTPPHIPLFQDPVTGTYGINTAPR